MNTKKIEYSNGKLTFIGQLYWDDSHGGKRPGILVFPEAFGLGEHALQRAEQLAKLGYVALAADPHGEGRLYSDMASLSPAMQALFANRDDWRSRAQAALDALAALPEVDSSKIAAVGYCMGGATCLELARTGAPLAAVVTFHASLLPELPGDAGRNRAKVLVCHGAEDPIFKQEAIDAVMAEFRRDKVDWQFIYYGNTVHSFTNPAADHYNNAAFAYSQTVDKRSWAVMRNLFDEVFN